MVILEMFLEDEILNGVDAFSLVNDPAMESAFVKLHKQHEVTLKVVDKEKGILMGVALIPNKLILRKDFAGYDECKIFFTAPTIRKISENFFQKENQNNSSLEHEIVLNKNTIVESWIKEHEVHDKSVLHDIESPLDSWIVTMKANKEMLDKADKGEITGFSIEGLFGMQVVNAKSEKSEKDIYNDIMKLKV